VVLKDCYDKIIYTSIVGKSKEKEYEKSFHEAIRNAFKDPILEKYSYKPQKIITKAIVKVPETLKLVSKVDEKTVVPSLTIPDKVTKVQTEIENVLYAQAINNGFQLVDRTPKVIFNLLKTKQENLFIIEGKNGIFYKNNSNWIAEYYENNILIQEEYQVKF